MILLKLEQCILRDRDFTRAESSRIVRCHGEGKDARVGHRQNAVCSKVRRGTGDGQSDKNTPFVEDSIILKKKKKKSVVD